MEEYVPKASHDESILHADRPRSVGRVSEISRELAWRVPSTISPDGKEVAEMHVSCSWLTSILFVVALSGCGGARTLPRGVWVALDPPDGLPLNLTSFGIAERRFVLEFVVFGRPRGSDDTVRCVEDIQLVGGGMFTSFGFDEWGLRLRSVDDRRIEVFSPSEGWSAGYQACHERFCEEIWRALEVTTLPQCERPLQ